MLIENANTARTALQGRVAVVTGAGQGIGRETARALAYLGAKVVIAEIKDDGQETERIIRKEGGEALFAKTDVSDPSSVESLGQQVLDRFGRVDILVNNAVAYVFKSVLEHSLEDWERVMAVNLRGAFLGIKAFLPGMLDRRYGVVVLMGSAEGMPYAASYFASKTGLRSLAMSLAQEIDADSGVSVYGFSPGMADTPGARASLRDLAPRYGLTAEEFVRQSAPGGELATAEEAATGLVGTILHASEFHGQEVDYVTGLALLGVGPNVESPPPDTSRFRGRTSHPTSEPIHSADAVSSAGELVQQAIALNRQLEDILRANIREYGELSMFQRPIVKRMFQQGTGLKVEDWLASAEDMTRRLESLATAGDNLQPAISSSKLSSYIAQTRRMVDFITKQESDARGFFRDPEKLRAALEALRQRKATAQSLADVLQKMNQG